MSLTTFLQIFLIIDVFIIGVLTPIAVRHGREHYRPVKPEPPKPQLPGTVKERMLLASEEQFKSVLQKTVGHLEQDLESTTDQINHLIKEFAGEIVGDELERYRSELTKLHLQAQTDMSGISKQLNDHKAELQAKLAAEMELEKQALIRQIDVKLGDAVGSFLVETLQHNVDLGNQSEFLVAMLEEHKDVFKQEVITP